MAVFLYFQDFKPFTSTLAALVAERIAIPLNFMLSANQRYFLSDEFT